MGEVVEEKERVCVTGAGGYVASWLVKFLLSKGYMVHGTVRDPCDEKNRHLKKMENATENLQLFKTDLLDYEGICSAIAGCTGVFHLANPVPPGNVPNPEVELIEPTVIGTRNVLNACVKAKVRKAVVVSSTGAVLLNPNFPKNKVMDENCWSDIQHCKSIERWYAVGKVLAENEALDYTKRGELNVVTICPSIVIGPMLQSTLNSSSLLLLTILRDGHESMENIARPLVDVRDVAEAIMLVYKKPKAEGRYICSSYEIRMQALADKLKSLYPNYNFPKSYTAVEEDVKLSSEKLQKLGWKYRPVEDTLIDAVSNYKENDYLSSN